MRGIEPRSCGCPLRLGRDEANVVISVRPPGVKNVDIYYKLNNKKSDVHRVSSITGYQFDVLKKMNVLAVFINNSVK